MIETFPDDVMETAVAAVAPMHYPDAMEVTEAIARAIAAERERAAGVIEQNMLCTDIDGSEVLLPRGSSGNKVGLAYAAAIRGTNA